MIGARGHGRDAVWIIGGVALTTYIAALSITGDAGLGALSHEPLMYNRDAISTAAIIKQAIVGNPLAGARLGYPFGDNWLDWPSLDWGILAIAKTLSAFTDNWVIINNLLFMLGFPLAFTSAFIVSRKLDITSASSCNVAATFTLASYHFERLMLHGHLFLTYYWVAPVYVWLAWDIAHSELRSKTSFRTQLARTLGIAVLAAFGAYYTAFGVVTLLTGIIYGAARGQATTSFRRGAFALCATAIGGLAQVAPTLVLHAEQGPNPLAFARSTMEAQLFAALPVQLLLPHLTHRISGLAYIAQQFQALAVGDNESVMTSVGAIASLGLWVLLALAFTAIAGRQVDTHLRFFLALGVAYTAFLTAGGLGLLTSMLGLTEIRAWNRLSIFLAFIGILSTFTALAPSLERVRPRLRALLTPLGVALVLALVWVDQTPAPETLPVIRVASTRDPAVAFIQALERRLPQGAAIYQLPFVGYPEGHTVRGYDAYEFMKPFVESRALRFNLGGMKGRNGDKFYRALAREPMATQISTIRRLGFSGVYVDRMGFQDYGREKIAELTKLLGPGSATWRSDRRVVYFDLHNTIAAVGTPEMSLESVERMSRFTPRLQPRRRGD